MFTHFPKDRNYEVCRRTKITKAPCRKRTGKPVSRDDKFGDRITADHKILNEDGESRNSHKYTVIVQDLATQWIQVYPCKTKTSQDTEKSKKVFDSMAKERTALAPSMMYFQCFSVFRFLTDVERLWLHPRRYSMWLRTPSEPLYFDFSLSLSDCDTLPP